MKPLGRSRLPLLVVLFASLAPAPPPPEKPGWNLSWSDEFEGDQIDKTKWAFDTGNGFFVNQGEQFVPGWGNDELQYYTTRPENSFVKDGLLHIVALKEDHEGAPYTSARLRSRKDDRSSLFSKAYGRFEFRAKLPTGQGIWPALWMLPQDEKYGGWAGSGEIDIMEARGQQPTKVVGTMHYGSGWPGDTRSSKIFTFPPGQTIAEFHVYALEWVPGEIRWFVDDKLFAKQSSWWSGRKPGGAAKPTSDADVFLWPAPFDQPFFLVMDLAVGGKFLGNPDASTPFPAEMQVDYVRVYEKVGGYGPPLPRGDENLPFRR